MANNPVPLNSTYHALADPTRRGLISRLVQGPASVTDLAQPFAIGLPTLLKHLKVLESSGLVVSRKAGRVRTCHLQPAQLEMMEQWLTDQRRQWEARADRLARYVETELDQKDAS